MARRIEAGTTLTGQDAIDFINYMENPNTQNDRMRL